MTLSESGRFKPLVKGEADCESMVSIDLEVSIEDGGDSEEVMLGEVELVVRDADG